MSVFLFDHRLESEIGNLAVAACYYSEMAWQHIKKLHHHHRLFISPSSVPDDGFFAGALVYRWRLALAASSAEVVTLTQFTFDGFSCHSKWALSFLGLYWPQAWGGIPLAGGCRGWAVSSDTCLEMTDRTIIKILEMARQYIKKLTKPSLSILPHRGSGPLVTLMCHLSLDMSKYHSLLLD